MRFLSFIPYLRNRRTKIIRIRRVRPAQPSLAISLHAAALAVLGLLAGAFILVGVAAGEVIPNQSSVVASPALLAILLSAHACTMMFVLNRGAH